MYNVLIVDDAKDSLLLLEFDLQAAGYKVIIAETGQQALQLLNTENIDMVLLDIYMPEMSGLAVLKQIKANDDSKNIPVIMLSASDDEDEIVQALEIGAVDYVIKPYINKVLLARMKTAFRLVEKTAQLEQMAKKDYLTGINNRRNFFNLAKKIINSAQRHHHSIVIVMCDIDHFKQVNDQYGHEVGDYVLKEVSQLISNVFRDFDIVGRIGGEEFAVCLPETSIDEAKVACERLRQKIQQAKFITPNSNQQVSITISIGMALGTDSNLSLPELLTRADQGLYQAKNTGRNQIIVYEQGDYVSSNQESSNKDIEIDGFTKQDLHSSYEEPYIEFVDDNNDYPGINTSTGLNNVLGDKKLFEQVLQMFIEDHEQDGMKLIQAFSENNIETMKDVAHTLKGVSSSIGAMALFKSAKLLDEAVNEKDLVNIESFIPPVVEKLSEVISGIKAKSTQ